MVFSRHELNCLPENAGNETCLLRWHRTSFSKSTGNILCLRCSNWCCDINNDIFIGQWLQNTMKCAFYKVCWLQCWVESAWNFDVIWYNVLLCCVVAMPRVSFLPHLWSLKDFYVPHLSRIYIFLVYSYYLLKDRVFHLSGSNNHSMVNPACIPRLPQPHYFFTYFVESVSSRG